MAGDTTRSAYFRTGVGNALVLIANEAKLLRELDRLAFVSEGIAIPIFMALVCRRSQLLDHACYRMCDGRKSATPPRLMLTGTEYEGAKFFLQQADALCMFQKSIFGFANPLDWDWSSDSKSILIGNDAKLRRELESARHALDGACSARVNVRD